MTVISVSTSNCLFKTFDRVYTLLKINVNFTFTHHEASHIKSSESLRGCFETPFKKRKKCRVISQHNDPGA